MGKVLVTGYGIINAAGKNRQEVFENLFAGKSGITKGFFESNGEKKEGSFGRVAPPLAGEDFFERNALPYDRGIHFALLSARECLEMGGFDPRDEDPYRRGVAIGTSLGGMLSGQHFHREWLTDGLAKADASYLKLYPLHALADVIAKEFGFQGPKCVISTACAASANAVGYGADLIRSGKYDYMLVGGADPLSVFSFAGFLSLRALDEEACSPYGESRGINLGEGAAFLLLESEAHAKKRGAKAYGQILSYGLTADAYHPTAPDPGGAGAIRAMKAALSRAGLTPEGITYINGHGTGTKANDKAERIAFKTVFRDQAAPPPMSSSKGAIGHTLGAAGAQECVISLMALQAQLLPPTVGMQAAPAGSGESVPAPMAAPAGKDEIDFVPAAGRGARLETVLSNSFAFGGNNCSLAIGPLSQAAVKEHGRRQDRIVITGKAACSVGGESVSQLFETFREGRRDLERVDLPGRSGQLRGVRRMPDLKKYVNPRTVRRTDTITRYTLAVGKMVLEDAGIRVGRENCERIGLVFATGTGPLGTIAEIDEKIITQGISSISLSEFPNAVFNAPAGQFCIANMVKGPVSAISEGSASFLTGLHYACELLKNDMADAMVVIGADECCDVLLSGYGRLGLLEKDAFYPMCKGSSGMVLSEGSVALVLEREKDALQRQAGILAEVAGCHLTSDHEKIASVATDGEALFECARRALEESGAEKGAEKPDLYIPSGMGTPETDLADANALLKLQREGLLSKEAVCALVTPLLGVCSGANAGYGLLGALYAFERDEVVGLPEKRDLLLPDLDELYPVGNLTKKVDTALVSSMSLGGVYASAVLRKYSP